MAEIPVPNNNDYTGEAKFNQLNHEVEIYLDNGITDNRVYINPNSIVNLTIHTSLADWVTRGSITVMYNPENAIEDISTITGQHPAAERLSNRQPKPNYAFRSDGHDFLRIKILPNISENSTTGNSGEVGSRGNIEFPTYTIDNKKFWSISHLFSIYDKEDIDMPPGSQNAASATLKAYKLYFWDAWYQKLNTTYIEYSTALSPEANIETDILETKYSNYGLISTGRAIKEIIDIGLSESNKQIDYTGLANTIPKLGGKPPTAEIGEEWEEGSAKIFYTAPAFATAYDGLVYIYNKHISSTGTDSEGFINDFSLLYKEKGPEENDYGYLTLKPISNYFTKAGNSETSPGEYQIEHFFIQTYDGQQSEINKTRRAPLGNSENNTVDIKTIKYHAITSYRFVDISALTNSDLFNNRAVYSFNFRDREFNTEFTNNKVTVARDFMTQQYINNLYKESTSSNNHFLITLNQDKEKTYIPEYSLDGDNPEIRQHLGLQQLLKIGVFQNLCINFRTLGLTYRVPGRFIGIDKLDGVPPGEFEDKFYGQWFIIDIKHVFEGEIYFNDITAVKIHRFSASPFTFPQTI